MLQKSSSIALGILFAATALFADAVVVAGWNWTDATGAVHEYGVVNDRGCSWTDAAFTVVDGWHLATVTSASEQRSLISGLRGLHGEYWLGGYQTGTGNNPEDDWAWVTNETWEYRNWAPGEPNDYFGDGSEQHLAVWSLWGESRWLWNDEAYLPNISGYVIERTQSVPEPGAVSLFALGLVALLVVPKKVRE